jgi:hypothetical protein
MAVSSASDDAAGLRTDALGDSARGEATARRGRI